MKKLVSTLTAFAYILCTSALAYASGTNVEPQANKEVIKTTIKGIATNFVGVAQGIFGIAAVVFVVWAGIIYWGAHGDPNKIQSAKRAFAGFIIAMVCVFFADKIVGGLMGIFGVK
ncbi:MAG TPA: hypothetical protein DEA47_01095 [Peptococcaceae bacterium]|nr:MAG: hypothetical protein XD50_0270 [Clostridia bacterium 41_269]HBT19960.1 hypothetical protein [Peptococcaceae bacterium]